MGITNAREKHVYALARIPTKFLEAFTLIQNHNCSDDGAETCLQEGCPVYKECGEVLSLLSRLDDVILTLNDVANSLEDRFPFLS